MRDAYDRGPASADERLEPVAARAYEAEALGVAEGSPLMLVERVAFDAARHAGRVRPRPPPRRPRALPRPRRSPRSCSAVRADLAAALAALEPELGAAETEPVALDGGITNRNFRVPLGGRDVVVRLPGKDTELLGHRPRGRARRDRRGGRRRGRPGRGRVPRVAAVPGHGVHPGPAGDRGGAARAGRARRRRRGAARGARRRRRCRRASTRSRSSRATTRPRRERGAAIPPAYHDADRRRAADPRGARTDPSTCRCRATTTC